MTKPRAYTSQEIQEMIYLQLQSNAAYWSSPNANVKGHDTEYSRMLGFAHSMLSFFAGCTLNAPAFSIVPDPHSEDKAFHKEHEENWFSKKTRVYVDGGSFYHTLKEHGLPLE